MLILLLITNIALAFIVIWTNEKLNVTNGKLTKLTQQLVSSVPGIVRREIERQRIWKEAFPMEGAND